MTRNKLIRRKIWIDKYRRTSSRGLVHTVRRHPRHIKTRPKRTVILQQNPPQEEPREPRERIKRHQLRDVEPLTTAAAATIKNDRKDPAKRRIVTAHDVNDTLAELVYPEDPLLQEFLVTGKVYGLVATPERLIPSKRTPIDFTALDERGEPYGLDRVPSLGMERDEKGRIIHTDIAVAATNKSIGLTPAFDSEFALSNFEGDREEFVRLLSLYMYWMDKNKRSLTNAVRTHNRRAGWRGKIDVPSIGRDKIIFLTTPNNKELAKTSYQLPLTQMARIKRVGNQTVKYGDLTIPKWDIDRQAEGDVYIIGGQKVKYGGVTSNVGQLPDESVFRQFALDFRYRYPTVFTKIDPETVKKVQRGSERVAKRDRLKNEQKYLQARRLWATQTRNSLAQAAPEKKKRLDRIKQLHVDPAYWEQSDYEIIKAVLGPSFVMEQGIRPPPRREAYGLARHKK